MGDTYSEGLNKALLPSSAQNSPSSKALVKTRTLGSNANYKRYGKGDVRFKNKIQAIEERGRESSRRIS
jgi:hypothetical protein